ncbi:unnamed protein product [Plutella xylostella]|uniref:(diamondback moth) hypothetical protein n=1 Tax=Plutella xylostella TaxID=51655 RepID=A0A8S4DQ07_PLUXY|nr:unnamed protein product [Plutella xylostella]
MKYLLSVPRVRPLNNKERGLGGREALQFPGKGQVLCDAGPGQKPKVFSYNDQCQTLIRAVVVRPLNNKERGHGGREAMQFPGKGQVVCDAGPGQKPKATYRSTPLPQILPTLTYLLSVPRVRPLNNKERGLGGREALQFPGKGQVVCDAGPGQKPKVFSYNVVFEPAATQEDIVEYSGIKRLLEMAVEGFSCTAFCYGQTGSGKTHTLTGPPGLVSTYTHTHTDQNIIITHRYLLDIERGLS